jgi:hypothetical protein
MRYKRLFRRFKTPELWRTDIGIFANCLVNELQSMGRPVKYVNVCGCQHDSDIPADEWRVDLKYSGYCKISEPLAISYNVLLSIDLAFISGLIDKMYMHDRGLCWATDEVEYGHRRTHKGYNNGTGSKR